jgi:AraC-like DNA-binding protein
MQTTLIESAPRRAMVPVTVAVGHASTLVSAGLAATLGRMPDFDFRLLDVTPATEASEPSPAAQLVFGDSALLKRLREGANGSPTIQALTGAKFVLVTIDDQSDAEASLAAGEIDECLSIECAPDELFATVRRLIDREVASARREWVAANELVSQGSSPAVRQPSGEAWRSESGATPGLHRSATRGGLAPGALRRVREYIDQHLTGKLPTQVLANVAGLSSGHFNRAFKQSTGSSPHRYVMTRRIAAATELLMRTSRALAEIALDVGFADQSHFCRAYVGVTGETPSSCRRRHR